MPVCGGVHEKARDTVGKRRVSSVRKQAHGVRNRSGKASIGGDSWHGAMALPRDFDIAGCSDKPTGQQVLVRYVKLHRNLREERKIFAEELKKIVEEGLGNDSS